MTNKKYTTPQYQRFCRIVCPALILLGMVLLAISFRTSQLHCQRSTGLCTISHPGIIPAPKFTFGVGYVNYALVEHTDGCCSSGTPFWYNLTIEVGALDKSYRMLYAWVDSETAEATLVPAADTVNQFLDDSTIPGVTIRLPDNRREDFLCGLYFLIAGLIYTLINYRVIFPGQQAMHPMAAGESLPATEDERPSKKERFGKLIPIWLLWTFVPATCALPCAYAFWQLVSFGRSYLEASGYPTYYATVSGFGWMMIVLADILLAYLIAMVWISDRKEPRGFPSRAARIICTLALALLGIALFLGRDTMLWSNELFFAMIVFVAAQAWIAGRLGMNGYGWTAASLAGVVIMSVINLLSFFWFYRDAYFFNDSYFFGWAYAQGRFSILGLVVGSILSVFQTFVLKQRVAHPGWWILGNALTCEVLFVIPALAVALFPRLPLWWSSIKNHVSSSGLPIDLSTMVIIVCFSALQGAVLLWMLRIDPAENAHGLRENP